MTIPEDVKLFLMGQAPLEGCCFGDPHPTRPGMFWWRSVIREREVSPAEEIGHLVNRIVKLAPIAGLRVEIAIKPAPGDQP